MQNIDYVLKRYRDDVPKPGSKAFDEIRRLLINPLYLTNSPVLSDEHPLKVEGYIILDAFESVTNGMENLQALQDLEKIQVQSVLFPWKLLILGLKAFYEADDQQCVQFFNQIPKDCGALYRLVQDFMREMDQTHKRHFKDVWNIASVFRDTLEMLESAASSENLDLFLETLEETAKIWQDQPKNEKIMFGQWVVQLSQCNNLDLKATIRSLIKTIGIVCAEQSVAFGLYKDSIETAVLFYARSLLDKEDPITPEEKTMIQEMYRQAVLFQKEAGQDDGFQREWDDLCSCLERLGITFAINRAGKNHNQRPPTWKKDPVQLDLFAS